MGIGDFSAAGSRLGLSPVSGAAAECAVQRECGGCPLMPLEIESQQRAKLNALSESLAKNGIRQEDLSMVGAPHTVGYRNRVRLLVREGVVRFFNQHKDASCAVLESSLRQDVSRLLELSASDPSLFAEFQHLELRGPDHRKRSGLLLSAKDNSPPGEQRVSKALSRVASALPAHLLGVHGDPEIGCQQRRIVDSILAWVPLDAFLQINDAVNARLVADLRAGAVQRRLRTALDLYAGSGNFSLPLAAADLVVTAVELHPSAIRALRRSAEEQRLPCEAFAEPAREYCARTLESGRRFDLIVIDAPRGGARGVIEPVLALAPEQIALCSCNVSSFARDLANLLGGGYRLDQLRAFDMFPHTAHLEVLAWLSRADRARS